MKKIRIEFLLLLTLSSSNAFGQEEATQPIKHTGPTPGQLAKNIVSSPFDPNHLKFPRGLKERTPAWKISSSKRFDKTTVGTVPPQVMMLPTQLSMWGNSQYGDCVSASEAARKAAYSVFCGLPETFIPEANVISWAQQFGYLNGANLTDVMTTMQTKGMMASDGKVYLDGPYASVDYSIEADLQAALSTGPVNFGIDASALPSGAGNASGWYAFGGSPGQFNNQDHCTPSFGYVTGATSVSDAFAAVSKAYGVTVTPPANAPTGNVYLWYTWSTVGIVDHAWIMSTVGEAWICNPTTVGQTPNPNPIPTGAPTISSALTFNVQVGVASTYTITGTNTPTSFGAAGLPLGFNLNETTGVITGTITTVGTWPVIVSATNSSGAGTATLQIISATTPPPPPGNITTFTITGPQIIGGSLTLEGVPVGTNGLLTQLNALLSANKQTTTSKLPAEPMADPRIRALETQQKVLADQQREILQLMLAIQKKLGPTNPEEKK